MSNIKLVLEYDGSNYTGWQRQNNTLAIQQVIEETIESVLNQKVNLIGCSRTDTGVHAREFVCNFRCETSIPAERLKYALNPKLPDDVVVIASEEVEEEFHSRYSCVGKTYVYTILNRQVRAAIKRDYCYQYKRKLNTVLMKEACQYFIGKHDFSAFRNLGSSVKTTVRTITDLNISVEGDKIIIVVSGDGFLYNMVRIIVGTLIDVGIQKINPSDIKYIIDSQDRKNAGPSVPAQGLMLYKVHY